MGKKNAPQILGGGPQAPRSGVLRRAKPEVYAHESLLRHSFSDQPGHGQKKRPPVAGRRSNYAHLTDINLQALCHRNVKRVHSVFTGGSADSSLIPQAGRKIQTSAGRNGLQINSQLIRVRLRNAFGLKHSIVSHRSPAIESGIFLLSGKFESEFAIELASARRHGSFW